jgi:hypothetical protein
MRFRVAMFPVVVFAALALTAAAAFGATIMVDSDGAATPTNCAGGAPGSAYLTIQGGVNNAAPGDTVKVCGEPAHIYAGATVATHSVRLVGVNNPVVQAANTSSNAFTLNADKVTVKGFEIQNSAAAIFTSQNHSGYQILHNNMHDNAIGIYLQSNGTYHTLIAHNNIHDQNLALPGGGNGIDNETAASNVTITENQFTNNDNEGILLNPQSGADSGFVISYNTFSQELGSDVAFLQTVNNSKVVHNTMSNTSADPANGGSSVFIGANSSNDTVATNTIRNPNFDGVAIRDTAHDIAVSRNTITGAGNNGLDVSSTAVHAVSAVGNKIVSSQNFGINFEAGTNGNNLTGNHATLSGGADNCNDLSTGTGTAGTANTWASNTAAPSHPVGICI